MHKLTKCLNMHVLKVLLLFTSAGTLNVEENASVWVEKHIHIHLSICNSEKNEKWTD